ncbi:MAG: AAA-associated domain-containing protein [Thermoplasmata archaeon]|nr:AAA-associated domain-containing protein [Thermoplasmata archaeon]
MLGLLVLLNDHKGDEDIARLGDDLDLEIDEILPALEFAAVLQLVSVKDGRATLTNAGRELLAAPIRERKTLLREQLKRTTLFKALLNALESAPERRLTEDEVNRLIEFTSAPADSLVQNIINWGRYAELFRYDSDAHALLPARTRPLAKGGGSGHPPATPPGEVAGAGDSSGRPPPKTGRAPPEQAAHLARALA